MTGSQPIRLAEISWRELPDGSAAVLSLARGTALVLNASAAVVLELCNGERTAEDIASFICRHVQGAAPEVVTADVNAIVARLREAGCIASED